MTNATVFGSRAAAYKKGRPGYPAALFDWITENAPAREAVWDCATGSGQAALSLAERFDQVFATDVSADQIAQAIGHERIEYSVAPAEASGLEDQSVDAVTVATALHWFDFSAYWDEVRRVLRPGGLVTAWAYGFMETDQDWEEGYKRPLLELIGPYWSTGNQLATTGYKDNRIQFPFDPIAFPQQRMEVVWTIDQLVAFADSWSATIRAREEAGLSDKIDALNETSKDQFANRKFRVRFPLNGIAGFNR